VAKSGVTQAAKALRAIAEPIILALTIGCLRVILT